MANAKDASLKPMIGLLGWLTVCYAVGFIGSQATMIGLPAWYPTLNKPIWNPPVWLFAPVWTVLYAMMGVAVYRVWRADAKGPLRLFLAQLFLNGLWSWLFFGWQRPLWALVEIVVFWFAIALTLRSFWRVDRVAGGLFVPYLAWVTFAAVLNFSIWQLNR